MVNAQDGAQQEPQPFPNATRNPDLGPQPPTPTADPAATPAVTKAEETVKPPKPKRIKRKYLLRNQHKLDGRYIPTMGWARFRYELMFWLDLWFIRFTFAKPGRYPKPYIPGPGWKERGKLAVKNTRNARFKSCKFVAFFNLKGGVGKTTLALMFAKMWKQARIEMAVLVQDCNRDRGTTADQIVRTVKFAISDLIANLRYILTLPDFTVYTSEDEGVFVLAGTRPNSHQGLEKVEKESWDTLHELESGLFNLVGDDCGTSTDSPSNVEALNWADQIVVPFTANPIGILMAKATFAYLLKKQPDKAKTAVFVAMRFISLPFRGEVKLQKIRDMFVHGDPDPEKDDPGFGELFDGVTILPMSYDLSLRISQYVRPKNFRRRVLVQTQELVSMIASRLEDGRVNDMNSQLTHIQMAELNLIEAIPPVKTQDSSESHGGANGTTQTVSPPLHAITPVPA